MTQPIQLFLLFEGAAFIAAALTHFGVLTHGYEHRPAGTAETVIGIVLLIGLALSSIRPRSTRAVGLAAQTFALFGTLVGIFTIIIGVGPRTTADITYHAVIVIVLVSGLIVAFRSQSPR
jgi:phosphatidylserine synthase